jgi:hypothetical protein
MILLALALLSTVIEIDVPVYAGASLPRLVLERALSEADRLFEVGGIRLRWQVSPELPRSGSPVVVVVLDKPGDSVVSGCRRNRHDHRLGHTQIGARRITLWERQVARAVAGDWDALDVPPVDEEALGMALGRVLAHELGHLFLRLNGHHDSGLMRPSFSHRALTGKSDRSFRLSESDWAHVRSAIERVRISAPEPGSASGETDRDPSSSSTTPREE